MSDLRERRDPRGAPQANDSQSGGGAGGGAGAGDGRSVRVLILDEDRVEGGMLAFHLRRDGLVVMLMTSVEEASDAIAWSAPASRPVDMASTPCASSGSRRSRPSLPPARWRWSVPPTR